ncbi:hypothetical protein R3W88_025868 [Solanum pinnatisectum]|uniref:Terpene synthase metal-binding domain-containing protein n=1 Tax=Solanum pinnatisectum TaxID=50273 RepID=A0AAV9M4A9_9SOLN|nr:hypothetical protein R3W88_025868 [Solanum pinnatisectum]
MMAATTFLCVMEENITKETFEWVINEPLILRASSVINRLKDDINTNDFEQQRSHVASFIECYMKEYGVSKQEAYVEARKKLTNAWKDMNEEFLTFRSTIVCSRTSYKFCTLGIYIQRGQFYKYPKRI